ncbi:trypsin-like peptidase domain-containing protein [Candidatus Woesearchaeota archaeon]|nr:trypsin-like peptidase domain-containing protein [Candidatus Woesearchaeota archaeon]
MAKKTISTLAAALFAVTIGGAQACSASHAQLRPADIGAVTQSESDIRQALEDITQSVHCVRTRTEYQRDSAEPDSPTRVRTGHGTAFAYMQRDGYTYLVTNEHVVTDPKTITVAEIVPSDGSNSIQRAQYNRLGNSSSILVDNGADDNSSDDIDVEVVATDTDLDIAIIRTRTNLHVSTSYHRDNSFRAEMGDEVFITGYPQGWELAATRGVVSNPSHESDDGEQLQLLDVTGTFGNSGSPYFVRRGSELYWAGTMGKGRMYRQSRVTMFILGTPISEFNSMLDGGATAHRAARRSIGSMRDALERSYHDVGY